MGNNNVKYLPIEYSFAKYDELQQMGLQKYISSGVNRDEALENLYDVCKMNGIPLPINHDGKYYCGLVKIMGIFKDVRKYNTVFFKERNGTHFAMVFYYRL